MGPGLLWSDAGIRLDTASSCEASGLDLGRLPSASGVVSCSSATSGIKFWAGRTLGIVGVTWGGQEMKDGDEQPPVPVHTRRCFCILTCVRRYHRHFLSSCWHPPASGIIGLDLFFTTVLRNYLPATCTESHLLSIRGIFDLTQMMLA